MLQVKGYRNHPDWQGKFAHPDGDLIMDKVMSLEDTAHLVVWGDLSFGGRMSGATDSTIRLVTQVLGTVDTTVVEGHPLDIHAIKRMCAVYTASKSDLAPPVVATRPETAEVLKVFGPLAQIVGVNTRIIAMFLPHLLEEGLRMDSEGYARLIKRLDDSNDGTKALLCAVAATFRGTAQEMNMDPADTLEFYS